MIPTLVCHMPDILRIILRLRSPEFHGIVLISRVSHIPCMAEHALQKLAITSKLRACEGARRLIDIGPQSRLQVGLTANRGVRHKPRGAEGQAVPGFHNLLVSPMPQPAVANHDAEIAALTASRGSFAMNCPKM